MNIKDLIYCLDDILFANSSTSFRSNKVSISNNSKVEITKDDKEMSARIPCGKLV